MSRQKRVSSRKVHQTYIPTVNWGVVNGFKPINEKQEQYFNLMHNKHIVVSTGYPGTGKSICPIAYALQQLHCKAIDIIYLTKPIVEVGSSIGFLPGKIDDKFSPYMYSMLEHMYDLLDKFTIDNYISNKKIICLPLEFMRGINLDKCIVIADEMQNSSYIQTKTLLTRLKENTQLIITGDLGQCDLDAPTALPLIMKILLPIDGVGFVDFTINDIVRSGIVKDIMLEFHNYESNKH